MRETNCSEYAPCIITSFCVTIVLVVIMVILFRGPRHANYDSHPKNLSKFAHDALETELVLNETRLVTLENGLMVEVKPIGFSTTTIAPPTTADTKSHGQVVDERGKSRPMTKDEENMFSDEILKQLERMKEIQDMLDQSFGPVVVNGAGLTENDPKTGGERKPIALP